MRNLKQILFVIMWFTGNCLLSQSTFDFVFFGNKYPLDTSSRTTDGYGNNITWPVTKWYTACFKGAIQAQTEEKMMEDPNNPGHFVIEIESRCNDTICADDIVDTVQFNTINKDSVFCVRKNGKVFPICSFIVIGDSMSTKSGSSFEYHTREDVEWENTYLPHYMRNHLWYLITHSNRSTKLFVTEISYFDYERMEVIKLMASILIEV